MRKDKQARHDQLCQLIGDLTAKECQMCNGHKWALRSRNEWAAMLGVSPPTLTELTNIAPIQKMVTMGVDDETGKPVKVMALRVGEPPTLDTRDMANIMAKAFRKQTGRPVSQGEWGMLNGLAEDLPDGYQIDIFRYVITTDGWHNFTAIYAVEIQHMISEAKEKGEPTAVFKRYYRHSSIRVLRLFWMFAADAYKAAMQEKKNFSDPEYPYFIDP
ncbi:hypothetical protein [Pseudophaeobacter flagellatus]|uniref:hypothetical protein n=1 Tax=Pseudophaeobacter flagellatus TaxID=2899119 RepID=UPI001E47FD59|nr:hypothetical protein [Pseudophaeobacter flagellatus]MCD9146727.1 hypothetical protein [Pseudophaeobacter flagellatus]